MAITGNSSSQLVFAIVEEILVEQKAAFFVSYSVLAVCFLGKENSVKDEK